MVKGALIKFSSYEDSINKLLTLLKVSNELKKYDKIILKPYIADTNNYTPVEFLESVLKFCIANKNPVAEVFIAEGSDSSDTTDLFESIDYNSLTEKYSIGLLDLNNTEVEEITDSEFLKFSSIKYPKILLESCVISLPVLMEHSETEIVDSLSNMLGAYPSQHYSGFFSSNKNKIRKWPMKYSIHDILICKLPNFAVIDASKQGHIIAGLPIEIDKTAAKLLGKDWRSIQHLKLAHDSFSSRLIKKQENEDPKIKITE